MRLVELVKRSSSLYGLAMEILGRLEELRGEPVISRLCELVEELKKLRNDLDPAERQRLLNALWLVLHQLVD